MSVLTYGPYSCTAEAAVQDSYLLNLAEAAVEKDSMITGEILADYCAGRLTFEEACEELQSVQ